jgi:nicotinic acid mononucleotide adenylyltransferase
MITSEQLVDLCHTTPHKCVIINSGGGVDIHSLLLRRGGGSATYLDGAIPHGRRSPSFWLKHHPEKAVHETVARGYAMAAYQHALQIREYPEQPVFGVGCTVVVGLGEGRPEREGRKHIVHAALQTPNETTQITFTFEPGQSRDYEETMIGQILLNLVAKGCEIEQVCYSPDNLITKSASATDCWSPHDLPPVIAREQPFCTYSLSRNTPSPIRHPPAPVLLHSSSFRPRHEAHIRMAEIAEEIVGVRCDLDLPIFNANKNPLTYIDIAERLTGLGGDHRCYLYLTNAATFIEKARLFPGCTFIVGYDTLERLPQPQFYTGGELERDWTFAQFEELGTHFIIFGRDDPVTGEFKNFDTHKTGVTVADKFFTDHVTVVPQSKFRMNMSSSEIRKEQS